MRRRRRRRLALAALLALLGVLLLAAGALDLIRLHRQPQAGGTPGIEAVIPPGAFPAGPLGPTPEPGTRIRLVDVGIDLPMVPGDGWNAPLFKAATYPGLKLPGEGGRAVVYAHARLGMFGPLVRSKVGQPVEVDEPDGTALHYVITQVLPLWPSTDLSWLQPLTHEQLVLVTCTTYNPNDPRVVVVAEPPAPSA
jgi:LPXTG-site transpeptidase (sortase) family protein